MDRVFGAKATDGLALRIALYRTVRLDSCKRGRKEVGTERKGNPLTLYQISLNTYKDRRRKRALSLQLTSSSTAIITIIIRDLNDQFPKLAPLLHLVKETVDGRQILDPLHDA